MIPLNEYPKEELEYLLRVLHHYPASSKFNDDWIDRVEEAISDQDFKEKELPFPDKKCDHEYLPTNAKWQPVNQRRCINCGHTIN